MYLCEEAVSPSFVLSGAISLVSSHTDRMKRWKNMCLKKGLLFFYTCAISRGAVTVVASK